MTRQTHADKLKALNERLAKTQRQIRAIKSREKDQARRLDARRKIIAGALALEHFAKNPDSPFGKIMFKLLDEYVRADNRTLFAFLPAREAPQSSDAAE